MLYLCDPKKNTECYVRSGCFVNGGDCSCTRNIDYKLDGKCDVCRLNFGCDMKDIVDGCDKFMPYATGGIIREPALFGTGLSDVEREALCSSQVYPLHGLGSAQLTSNMRALLGLEENNGMKRMLETQKKLQEFLGTDFESMSTEERVAFIKEHSIHLNQEINEALYELPYFKPWKNYDDITEEQVTECMRKYKEEMIDAFHFFMNMLIAMDFQADEFEMMYMEKNAENIERQKRGYTHDVSYRDLVQKGIEQAIK